MDDYVKTVLRGQGDGESTGSERLRQLLEAQGGLGSEMASLSQEEQAGQGTYGREEGDAGRAYGYAREAAAAKSGGSWEDGPGETGAEGKEASALKETAAKQFLDSLEREISALGRQEAGGMVVYHRETAGETSSIGPSRTRGETVTTGTGLSPEGLSRYYQRDARRYG